MAGGERKVEITETGEARKFLTKRAGIMVEVWSRVPALLDTVRNLTPETRVWSFVPLEEIMFPCVRFI